VQQRVLALIFGHPERTFYTSEIVRNVHSGTGAVEREERLRCGYQQRKGLYRSENHQSPKNRELSGNAIEILSTSPACPGGSPRA
jgi:hypothetical protein